MPNFKAYLRNFSKTLGILKHSSDAISATAPTQAASYHEFIAPCDGFMRFNIAATYYWVSCGGILCQEGDAGATLSERGATIPVKKGSTYYVWSDWAPGSRYEMAFIPLNNSS